MLFQHGAVDGMQVLLPILGIWLDAGSWVRDGGSMPAVCRKAQNGNDGKGRTKIGGEMNRKGSVWRWEVSRGSM